MTETAKEAKREYMRRWRANNKEKLAANQQKYWERKAAEFAREKEEKENAGRSIDSHADGSEV